MGILGHKRIVLNVHRTLPLRNRNYGESDNGQFQSHALLFCKVVIHSISKKQETTRLSV